MKFSHCNSISGRGGLRRHASIPTPAEQRATAFRRMFGVLWGEIDYERRSRAERARVEQQIRRDARVGQDFRPRWQRRSDPLRDRS